MIKRVARVQGVPTRTEQGLIFSPIKLHHFVAINLNYAVNWKSVDAVSGQTGG